MKLKAKLSLFGISVLNKDKTIEVLSDPCRRNTNKRRRNLTERLNYSILHCYLINNFTKLFINQNKTTPEILKFDFK